MPEETPTADTNVSWLTKNWTHVLWAVVAVIGWAFASYQAVQRGQPIPAPPVIAPGEPAADETSPPGAKRHYGWSRPGADEVPERVFSAPAGAPEVPPVLHLMSPPAPVAAPAPLPFDQGQLGSCGPNSAAALLLFSEAKAGKTGLPPPSRLFVYYTTRALMGTTGQDSGVSNATMFRALALNGWCDESQWPYDISRFRSKPPQAAYAQAALRKVATAESVPQVLGTMKACLAAGKPFVYGFDVYPSFETQKVEQTGVVPMPGRREQAIGGHDVLVTGYDDRRKAFRFLNSWGADWGDQGFGWMPYTYATSASLAGDFWTIRESGR